MEREVRLELKTEKRKESYDATSNDAEETKNTTPPTRPNPEYTGLNRRWLFLLKPLMTHTVCPDYSFPIQLVVLYFTVYRFKAWCFSCQKAGTETYSYQNSS